MREVLCEKHKVGLMIKDGKRMEQIMNLNFFTSKLIINIC